jgi:uncharacterized metal-binding protein
MNGDKHELVNEIPLIVVIPYLIFNHMGSALELLFSIGFLVQWIIHTYYITPDLDIRSKSSRRMWIIGWITSRVFKHHGILHSNRFWVGWFTAEYIGFGYGVLGKSFFSFESISISWWVLGGIYPIWSHLFTDYIFNGR